MLGVLAGSNTSFDRVVVLEWRMPRMLMALLIGAALGVSGAIFQALTRNPLGSPDIIGINAGAYTGALVVIAASAAATTRSPPVRWSAGSSPPSSSTRCPTATGSAGYRLIVVGIAVSAVLNSVNQWIVIKLDHPHRGHRSGLAAGHPQRPRLGAGAADDGVPGRAWPRHWWRSGPQLPVLQMGDDAAGALGVRPDRARLAYLVVGVGLVALACAAAGPITFVALAAPQLARTADRAAPASRWCPSAAMGAVLLLVSDVIAQQLFPDNELPVGAVTVSLGGVYLIYLLITQARKR